MKRFLVTLVTLIPMLGIAQRTITGTVKDSSSPLVGATVLEVGTDNGTITDDEGQFSLETSTSNPKLQISFVGFEHKVISPTSNSISVTLLPDYELEEIIIQTVRADNDPVTYSNLDRKQIEKVYNGEQPIFLLEELTPSIYSYSESGTRLANYGNLRLRGISQERINMTLNGIPLNDMIDHGVFFSNFTDIGNSIESVQVQRGAGTSSNGVASYAGSINFESINLRGLEAGGSLEMGIGSFNSKRFNASASTGMIDDKWSAYGSFSRLYSDGYRRNTFSDSYSFFLSVGYFGEKDFIKINAFDANSKNGLGYSAVLKSDLDADPKTNYLNENDEDDFGQQLVQLQHTHLFSDALSMISSLYYGAAGGDYLYTYPDSETTFAQINYPLYNDHYGVMSNFFFTPGSAFELSGGIHAYTFNRINEESVTPDFANPYYRETSDKKEFSAFAKATVTLGDLSIFGDLQVRSLKLSIQPDYDYIGISPEGDVVKDWTFINPKVGVTYQPNEVFEAYASYGRSGREPTRTDLLGSFGLYGPEQLDSLQADVFNPEFVNDLEAGVRFRNENLALAANYFYMDFQDEIVPYGEVIEFGAQLRTNIPNSYRTGLELQGSYSVIPQLKVQGNVSYMKSQIENLDLGGETLENITPTLSPEWIFSGSIGFEPISDLLFEVSGRGISDSYLEISNDDGLVLPAYFVSNFRVNYALAFLELALEVNNLADKNYYTNGAPVDVDFDGTIDGPGYIINAGRNVFFTTRIKF